MLTYLWPCIKSRSFKQADLEIQSLQRKLKLSEDDLDRAEDQLAEANSRIKEYETEIEEMKRYVVYGESLWLQNKSLAFQLNTLGMYIVT